MVQRPAPGLTYSFPTTTALKESQHMPEVIPYHSSYETTQHAYIMDPDHLAQQQAFECDDSSLHWPRKRLPHSHHGTPAHEHTGFAWPDPSFNSDISHPSTSAPYYQPSTAQSPPIPPWPSQLSSFVPAIPPVYEQQVFMTTMPMAPPAVLSIEDGGKPTSTGRRTLSDEDRKRMCEYAQDHPGMKQLEIGRHFGVDRSTVSKVLRLKDKFIPAQPPTPPPPPKDKVSRLRNVEKAMINWGKNEREKGRVLTPEDILSQAFKFSASTGGNTDNPTQRPGWLQKFIETYVTGTRTQSVVAEDETLLPELGSPEDDNVDASKQEYHQVNAIISPQRDRSASILSSSTSSSNLKRSPIQQRSYSSGAIFTEQSMIAGFVEPDIPYFHETLACCGAAAGSGMYAFAGPVVKRQRPIAPAPTLVHASTMPTHFPTPESDNNARSYHSQTVSLLSPPQSTTQELPSLTSLPDTTSPVQEPDGIYWTSPTYEENRDLHLLAQRSSPPDNRHSVETIDPRAMMQRPQPSSSSSKTNSPEDKFERHSAEPRTAEVASQLENQEQIPNKAEVARMALEYLKKIYEEKTGRALNPNITVASLEKQLR